MELRLRSKLRVSSTKCVTATFVDPKKFPQDFTNTKHNFLLLLPNSHGRSVIYNVSVCSETRTERGRSRTPSYANTPFPSIPRTCKGELQSPSNIQFIHLSKSSLSSRFSFYLPGEQLIVSLIVLIFQIKDRRFSMVEMPRLGKFIKWYLYYVISIVLIFMLLFNGLGCCC